MPRRCPEDTLLNRDTTVRLTSVHATLEHVMRDVVNDHFHDTLITALDRLMSLALNNAIVSFESACRSWVSRSGSH